MRKWRNNDSTSTQMDQKVIPFKGESSGLSNLCPTDLKIGQYKFSSSEALYQGLKLLTLKKSGT